jgi:glycosyltransferase involved in cell wall biosynthesis
MKYAVFHDYFGVIGGGERVAVAIANTLNADIITTDTERLNQIGSGLVVKSLGKPLKTPPFKQISAACWFSLCDVSDEYDLFIFSGNWAHHAAVKHHPNVWYCHTPVRAFYDLYDTLLHHQPFLQRQAFKLWTSLYRNLDQRAVSHVDRIVTNSSNTLRRIQRYYHRDAEIIYPPVDTSLFFYKEYGDFWLSVNRLYPEKRIDLQIEAFRLIPDERLIIVGGYAEGDSGKRYFKRLLKNLPANVEIRGEVTQDELIELYASCKAFITSAIDEDFGMTPLEAMTSGKPVVAVREGGYMESVIDGRTGFLVNADVPSIKEGIRKISKDPARFKDECINQSKLYDMHHFEKKIHEIVQGMKV